LSSPLTKASALRSSRRVVIGSAGTASHCQTPSLAKALRSCEEPGDHRTHARETTNGKQFDRPSPELGLSPEKNYLHGNRKQQDLLTPWPLGANSSGGRLSFSLWITPPPPAPRATPAPGHSRRHPGRPRAKPKQSRFY
jgi:hypothetical protein